MTTPLFRRAYGVTATIVLLVASSAASETRDVQIGALFTHGQPPAIYLSALGGVVSTTLESFPNGPQLGLRLGLGDGACRLWMMWAPDPKTAGQQALSPTAAIETCLVQESVNPAAFDDWLRGGTAPDPTLRVQLQFDPKGQGDRWTNGADVKAALLVRDCDGRSTRHRFYGTLTIPAGALIVDRGPNQAGDLRLLLQAKSATVGAVDPKTWQNVIRGCGNGHAALPDLPTPGFATTLIGRSDRVADIGAAARTSLEDARHVLEDLVETDVLERPLALELVRPLDRVEEATRRAQREVAIKAANQIVARVDQVIPPQNVAAVAGPIVAAVTAMSVFGDSQVISPKGCPQLPPCVSGALLVDAAAKPGSADGTPAHPFRTIRDALDAAAARAYCAVVVAVRPGTYAETLAITRHTRIVGTPLGQPRIAGSITQTGPYELTLERVDLWETSETALHVRNACAVTALRGVRVTSATGFGIVQEGGTITGVELSVTGTFAGGDGRGGRAIVLADGAQGYFNQVVLTRNEGQALLLDGDETRVFMVDLHADDNRLAPALTVLPHDDPQLVTDGGAVIVRNGALLLATWSHMVGNEHAGLVVTSGARAHFQESEITATRSVIEPFGSISGTNAVSSGGTLQLSSFSSTHAPLCGLYVDAAGGLRASDGELSHSRIGACVLVPDFNIECLTDGVVYRDNGTNVQSVRFTVPALDIDGADPGSEPAPPPEPYRDARGCASVPFTCDWCVRHR